MSDNNKSDNIGDGATRLPFGPVWRPIETAPKDGTWIVLCQGHDADGDPMGRESFGIFCQVAAWWEGEEAWIVYCSMVRDPQLHFDPTHWMPLPEPPPVAPKAEGSGVAASPPNPNPAAGEKP